MKFKVSTSEGKTEFVEARRFTTELEELKFFRTSDDDDVIAVFTRGSWLKVLPVSEEE